MDDKKILENNQIDIDEYQEYFNGQAEVEREKQIRESISLQEAMQEALEESDIQNSVLVT